MIIHCSWGAFIKQCSMRLAINHESSGLVHWWQSFVLVRASACSMAHVVTPLVIFGRHPPTPKLVTFLSHSSTKHPPTPKCHGCDKNCRETLPCRSRFYALDQSQSAASRPQLSGSTWVHWLNRNTALTFSLGRCGRSAIRK